MSVFSKNLCYFREQKKMTRAEVAKKLNISATSYGYYELGQREPKFCLLDDIASVLGTTVPQLFTPQDNTLALIYLKDAIDDNTGFLVTDIDSESISVSRVNFNTKESKDKNQRFIHVTENNTLTFKTEDIRELFQHCTQYVGIQIFSNTLKSLFVQHGLSDVIIGADAYLPGKENEGNFVGVSPDMYPATKGLPRKDNQG